MPKRGENIYKRKDGRWEGRYIRGRSPSGRAEYGYVYAGSYRECRAKRQKCLDACREAPVAASSLTLNQAAERFLADKQDDLKRSTLARYTYVLKHYILPVFGAVLLSQLTANQISEFLRRLQKNGLSGKSARDVGVLLKSILRYSAKKLDCPSPGMTVELPAYRRKQIDIFYPDEIQRLAQMIMDEPTTTGIGILLTLNTGLRLGELCALQYKDIDLRNGVVHVRKTVQRIRSGDRTSLMVLPPKSDSARRTIPLPGDMAALLQKLVQSHPNGENYLLTGKNVPMEPRTMQYQYRALLESSGYPVPKFSHAAAHIRLPLCGAWDRCKEPERDAGSCGCPHYTSSLCPFVPGAQNAGDPKHLLPCSGAGRRICAVTVSVSFSGNAPISTAFGSAIANGVNLRNPISGIPILSFPIKPKLILKNKIIESDDATRRSSEPETAR